MRSVIISICLLQIASCHLRAHDGESQQVISYYSSNLSAVNQKLVAELQQASHRLNSLQELFDRGHASWLETRKQKLIVDQLAAKSDAFAAFVSDCETAITSGSLLQSLGMIESSLSSVEFSDLAITHDDLNREALKNQLSDLAVDLREELAEKTQANQKLKRQTDSLAETDSWKKGYELKLQVADADVLVCQTRLALVEQLLERFQLRPVPTQEARTECRTECRTGCDKDFTSSVVRQCELHGRLIQHRLMSERHRLAALKSLQEKGIESTPEIKALDRRIEWLEVRADRQQQVLGFLKQLALDSVGAKEDPNVTDMGDLMQLRRKFMQCETEYQLQSALLEQEMLVEVLSRLEKAAAVKRSSTPTKGSGIADSLIAVREKEINSYRSRIEFEEIKIKLATARADTLAHLNSGNGVVLTDRKLDFVAQRGQAAMLSAAFAGSTLTNVLVPAENKNGMSLVFVNNPVLSNVVGCGALQFFPMTFATADADYYPIKLIDHSQILRHRYRRSSTSGRSDSTSRFNLGPSSLTFQQRRSYVPANSGVRRPIKQFDRAYYNGIIRSELRPFLNPGQPPWYLPGSPTNLRVQQLRTNQQRDTFGRTGNELLRSRIYSDLYGR